MNNAEDLICISRILFLNDQKAFEVLVNKYQSSLRRYLLYLTQNNQVLSDDLAQEAFIKAYVNLQSFKGIAGFQTWLFRIAYRLYCDHIRSKKAIEPNDFLPVESHNTEFTEKTELSIDLSTALNCLKGEEKSILLLFYIEDMSINDIAKVMEMPTGTIKSHLSRGRSKLKDFLKGYNNGILR